MHSRKACISAYALGLVLASVATFCDVSANAFEHDPAWSECSSTDECRIIVVGGCIGRRAINARFEGQFRAWAFENNRRLNCVNAPNADCEKSSGRCQSDYVAECRERRCQIIAKGAGLK